jgi:hypothetical protein
MLCFQDGKVAICYAAHAGHVCVVRYLLNLKCDVSNLLTDKTVRTKHIFPRSCGEGKTNITKAPVAVCKMKNKSTPNVR